MSYKSLISFQKAYDLALDVFELSKRFPAEEKYALTDQMRRCSRSVCAQLAEGYRKRTYPKYFKAKLIDCDGENSELQVWIMFAKDCGYLPQEVAEDLAKRSLEVGKLLSTMIRNPSKFSS